MIDVTAINAGLVRQNEALQAEFARISANAPADATHALIATVVAGLAAIHERQGDMITLMLRTGR